VGGIAAVVTRDGEPAQGSVERMLAPVPHRGGVCQTVATGRAVLGIVGRPDRPDASVAVVDGVAAAFTGVLDNAEELAVSLGRHNGVDTRSPARLLIDMFRRFGDELPSRLRGTYSAVVTDGQRLVCFRDHLGLDTLFYRRDATGCWVASEAKQVTAGAGIPREPNLDVLEQIFFKDVNDGLPSALAGVERLPCRTVLVTDGSALRTRRYWDPVSLLETARLSMEEIHLRFDELMTQAADRMVTGADAVSLSGGIDSPAVAAYAAPIHLERSGTPLQALTFVYPDHPSADERRYAELVADDLEIPFHPYVPRAQPLARLDEWMALTDGPFGPGSMSVYEEHYRQARALGARTVLLGELAEVVIEQSQFVLLHLLASRRFEPLRARLQAQRARGVSRATLGRELLVPFVPSRLTAYRARRRPLFLPTWVDVRRANEARLRNVVPAGERWRAAQFAFIDVPSLGAEAEAICQQVCQVRARRPWVDVDLWQFFLSLPAEVRFPPAKVNKSLVRHLLRGRVPDAILDRWDKTAFNEATMAGVDYPVLERWLLDPPHRLRGVDYEQLADRLRARCLDDGDYAWARSLASVHAFLATW
jgi:asparagine synthase (glutamine-hydrolysing)